MFRTPSPTAIAMGVERPYATPSIYGVVVFDEGQGMVASLEPRPRPSNVWWNTRTT